LKHGITDDFFVKTQDDTFPTAVNNATDIVGFGVYRTGFIARKIEPNGGVDKGGVITPEFLWLIHPDGVATFPLGSTMAESYWEFIWWSRERCMGFVNAPGK
jgi:hypothetical protein